MDVEKRQPIQAKAILPRIVVVIIIKVDEGLFSANRMESTANADMVVKASNERRWVDIPIISSFQGQT